MLWLQLVTVGDMLSYNGDDCPPWLGALSYDCGADFLRRRPAVVGVGGWCQPRACGDRPNVWRGGRGDGSAVARGHVPTVGAATTSSAAEATNAMADDSIGNEGGAGGAGGGAAVSTPRHPFAPPRPTTERSYWHRTPEGQVFVQHPGGRAQIKECPVRRGRPGPTKRPKWS